MSTTILVGDQYVNSSLCDYAQYLSLAPAVQVVQWSEIGFDTIAFGSLTFFIRTKHFRKVSKLANPNMKIIGATGILCYYVSILFSLALHVYFKIRSYTAQTPCDFLWYPLTCIIFRIPVYYCFVCFSIFHLTLFIERAITTFCKVQLTSMRFGILMSILTLVLPIGITSIPLSTDNFTDLRSYCFSNSSMKPMFVVVCMCFTALIDVLVTLGDIWIFIRNKRSLKSKHSTTNYTLANSFRLRETQLSMNIIFPYASIHAGLFLLYLMAVIGPNFLSVLSSLDKTSAILQTVSITKSIYLVGVPVLLILFVRNDDKEDWLTKQKQVSTQSYFDQFNQQVRPQRIIPLTKVG